MGMMDLTPEERVVIGEALVEMTKQFQNLILDLLRNADKTKIQYSYLELKKVLDKLDNYVPEDPVDEIVKGLEDSMK